MARDSRNEKVETAWTPDLFGPIFKKKRLTLKQTLHLHNVDEQIHRMASFVPDEIIYSVDLSEKSLRSFRAVLMFLNIPMRFSTLFKNHIYHKNGGSLTLTKILNDYLSIVIREIYSSEGDLLKFSAEGILVAWKVHDDKFIFDIVQNVVLCAINIQNYIVNLENFNKIYQVNIVISAGEVTFSIIGNDEARNFVIFGPPIEELKIAKRISLPNDLILSLSAWKHCVPSKYEYVIKDQNNVKILRILQLDSTYMGDHIKSSYDAPLKFTNDVRPSSPKLQRESLSMISLSGNFETESVDKNKKAKSVIGEIIAINPQFGTQLKSYLTKPVIQQIEKGESLKLLAEIKRITIISLDIMPQKCSDTELILLVDKCFLFLHSIAIQYEGYINVVNLYDKNIFFSIAFGIYEYVDNDQFDETCKNGMLCAIHISRTIKTLTGIHSIFIGISTGMTYCGVIGHIARKYYAIIGHSVDTAIRMMNISHDRISCDYDTVLHSQLEKNQFRSRGLRTLRRFEKYHVYEFVIDTPIQEHVDTTSSLTYCYPILGRTRELEYFNKILDEIKLVDRKYSGLLIEGIERSGKSRLLDAFVKLARARRIRIIKLSLHIIYAEKAYSVIYHIILQILEAEDCETVGEREKVLLDKLSDILVIEDFCYLNALMRVHFPLSDTYLSDTDWQRHIKTVDIFETILKELKINVCILLDDIQNMDYKSWQFLSSALDNQNIIIAMTMLKPRSWDDLSHVEAEIYKDKRIMNHELVGLDLDLLPIFACQFLNVFGISEKLSSILQEHKDGHIGWCETYLTSILQTNGLDFLKITPREAIKRNLVFPDSSLVTKLPIELMPEELSPPLPWSQMDILDVCILNENYFQPTDKDCNITELMSKIYDRMNPYEQDFMKCGATLGRVFKRSMVENVMPNAIPPHTSRTISEMIRMRILECASLQRRDFHYEDLIFCIDTTRQTFSDMHHLVSCHCSRPTITHRLPLPKTPYAQCKMLEFKVAAFHNMIYNMQTNKERNVHHTRAAKIYGQDAQKCNSCGSDRFLRILREDLLKEMEKENVIVSPRISMIRRRTIEAEKTVVTPKMTPLPVETITTARTQDSLGVRVSIMPTSIDIEEEDAPKKEENKITAESRFQKQFSSFSAEMIDDTAYLSSLETFSHVDYRNCQCDSVVSHLFWRMHQHIEQSGETEKVLEFFIQYSAAVIQLAQSFYAINLLSIAAKKCKAEIDEWINDNTESNIMHKGIILALMGDAYNALGNYDQAKRYYLLAVKLRDTQLIGKGICYNILRMFCKLRAPPDYIVDEKSVQLVVRNMELASYLRRLCSIFMKEDKLKMAQSFALRSFRIAFQSIDSFLEKGQIYLATVRVLHHTRSIRLITRIERPMLITIKEKIAWNDVEELVILANIYLMMYQIRVLSGELEEAVEMGTKVFKISRALHLNKLMLIILPSLIQIMLWTRRINKTVDFMWELYFLADEDIDWSAKTWYYALSLDLMLDGGIVLESYETSYNYYKEFIAYRPSSCVWRDPQSLCRLLTNLWLYQLRMGQTVTHEFVCSTEKYVKDISYDDFSQILTCSKGLECYLLILLRYIDMKRSNDLLNLQNISKMIKCLKRISKHTKVIKPRLYLLIAYLNVLRGRNSSMRFYLYKAKKFTILQGNQLIMAWIIQNKRTWKEKRFNNMARYWVENIGSEDIVAWQYICNFNIDTWSTILYTLPLPNIHL